MRRRFVLLSFVVALAAGVPVPGRATTDASLANWIISAQLTLDNGIKQWIDVPCYAWRINPYWANWAGVGLARTYTATGTPLYAEKAWGWLHWYAGKQAALSPPYYVNDYTYTNCTPPAQPQAYDTGQRDSTDSYAATYLLALWETYEATGNAAELATFLPSIPRAITAIESTLDVDGLTFAYPGWPFKYLMDAVEVYAGLTAASRLAGTLGDTLTQQRALSDAAGVAAGIEQLWNPIGGYYHKAKGPGFNGTKEPTSWSTLYADSIAQVWAVALGNWFTEPAFHAVPAARASAIVSRFASQWPNWARPSLCGHYLPIAGTAFLAVGRTAEAAQAATTIRQDADAAQRAWPFTTGNAGQLALLEVVT